jgi:hypothetical protein
MLRRIAILASAATMAVGLFATAAHAQGGTTCSSYQGMVTIRPGLTFADGFQRLTDHGSFSGCVGGGVTSATLTAHARGFTSCTPQPGAQLLGVAIAHWNNGKTSVISLTFTATSNPAVLDVTGTVIGGLFRGSDLTLQDAIAPANPGANCTTVPLTAATLHNTEPVTIA